MQEVIFYDLGAGSAVASLVQFSSFKGKEFGKVKNFGQFEVKAVTWDETIGVSDLDMILVEHFADEFNKKQMKGDDVRKYPKVCVRKYLRVRELIVCKHRTKLGLRVSNPERWTLTSESLPPFNR